MAGMTNYLENKLVDLLFRGVTYTPPTTLYFALLTNIPDDSTSLVEVSGGSYARVAVTSNTTNWAGTQSAGSTVASTGTSGTTSNNNTITFPSPTASWGTILGVAIMDAATGGNALFQGALAESKMVATGSPAPSFPAAAFACQIDN